MYEALVARVRYHIKKANFMGLKDAESTLLLAEAADTIEELICEVATEHNARLDTEERQRWIPVTERLPDEQDEYLVLWRPKAARDSNRLFYAILENDGSWVDDIPQSEPFRGFDVVYWMPLPQPPEEG